MYITEQLFADLQREILGEIDMMMAEHCTFNIKYSPYQPYDVFKDGFFKNPPKMELGTIEFDLKQVISDHRDLMAKHRIKLLVQQDMLNNTVDLYIEDAYTRQFSETDKTRLITKINSMQPTETEALYLRLAGRAVEPSWKWIIRYVCNDLSIQYKLVLDNKWFIENARI